MIKNYEPAKKTSLRYKMADKLQNYINKVKDKSAMKSKTTGFAGPGKKANY